MSVVPWSAKSLKVTPVDDDELMIIDSEDIITSTQNKRITIGSLSITGEANTASNSGTGEGLAQTKSGIDLPFKSLIGETDKITLTGNTNNVTFTLGTDVVTTDQANIYDNFDQSFRTENLNVLNPATTFSYDFVSAAITSDINVIFPLLSSDDTFVFEAAIQTLTNKTIDGDNNTISDIAVSSLADGTSGELITWDAANAPTVVATGTASQILTSNGAGLPPTFQAAAGTGLTSLNADTTAAQVIAVGTGLGLVDAGATHTLSIDSTVVTNDSTTTFVAGTRQDFLGLLAGTSGLNVGGIAGNPTTQVNGDIWLNTSTNQLFGRINGADVDLGAVAGSSQTPWLQNIDADTFNLFDLGALRFNGAVDVTGEINLANNTSIIWDDAVSGISSITVNASDDMVLSADGQSYTFSSVQFNVSGSEIINVAHIRAFGTIASEGFIRMGSGDSANQGIAFDLATGDFKEYLTSGTEILTWEWNSVTEYEFNLTEADFNGNNLNLNGGLIQFDDVNTTIDEPTTDSLVTTVGTIQALQLQEIGSEVNVVPGQLSALATTATDGFLYIPSMAGTPTGDSTDYTGKFPIVWDSTGSALYINTTGTTWIEIGGGGSSQTPWTSNIDADGFDLQDLSNIEFRETTGLPAGTVPYIAQEATGITINVPTGDSISLDVNAGTEYSFSATLADFQGNNIQDIPNILDSNGAELIIFTTTTSAVNELTLVNAATATPVEIQATGGDTNVDVQFTPKGTGTFYGNREVWGWPLTDETTAPTTGVKYTTEPAPYDMSIEDAIGGLSTAGTTDTFIIDVLKEDSVNADTFTSIFTTNLVSIDATEFTSTTAATQPSITTITWEKGRRLQLSINTLDTGATARGVKLELITHATAK